jgi:hypothetical protein
MLTISISNEEILSIKVRNYLNLEYIVISPSHAILCPHLRYIYMYNKVKRNGGLRHEPSLNLAYLARADAEKCPAAFLVQNFLSHWRFPLVHPPQNTCDNG